MISKRFLIASAAIAATLPALAQDRPESILPPGFGNTQSPANSPPSPQPSQTSPATASSRSSSGPGAAPESQVVETIELGSEEEATADFPPPVELPDHARREPGSVGGVDAASVALGDNPWGQASGKFLSVLMRRMDTPLVSRWVHIALRNAVFANADAPADVDPVDWVAERAWLLLRMGEADAARILVAGVDVDRFTPKMYQVAIQTALANADPSGLCPLEGGISKVEPHIAPLVASMCAALAGEPESAASQIETARRRGRVGGIDLVLAQKVVGAGADTGRAVTVEWEPVEQLNAWRFGLATGTGMTFPERLIDRATPQLRAWQARAPLVSPSDRLESARIATGLGVFSSQALIDLYSLIYDSTDPNDLPETDAFKLRTAFVDRDLGTRLGAMRQLWNVEPDPVQREASRALLGRAAARVTPDVELESDAANLISSMLAAGYDREAARWISVVEDMDDDAADPIWAMLALAAPSTRGLDLRLGRINDFIGRDQSPGRKRSALLVAGLVGLGRLDGAAAGRLNARHDLRIDRRSRWTELIDASAARRQAGTVAVLAGAGFQAPGFNQLPPSHLFHAVAGLRSTNQQFLARMIAAEALSRTL